MEEGNQVQTIFGGREGMVGNLELFVSYIKVQRKVDTFSDGTIRGGGLLFFLEHSAARSLLFSWFLFLFPRFFGLSA